LVAGCGNNAVDLTLKTERRGEMGEKEANEAKGYGGGQLSTLLDVLRGFAICSIIIHHWLTFIPRESSTPFFQEGTDLVETVTGTMVHLFFILSGYGLTLSYFRSHPFAWSTWAKQKFMKIVFPYIVLITAAFLLVNLLNDTNPRLFEKSFSWATLVAYLLFGRNFYEAGMGFNPTLWFMPVIIGLYILFPFLLLLLKKRGPYVFLFISALLTYASITVCFLLRYPVTHQTALPLFFIVEFSLGMVLAKMVTSGAVSTSGLATAKMFGVGAGFYVISWALSKWWMFGDAYNDIFTAAGVLLLTLYPCRLFVQCSGARMMSALRELSKNSYIMYLLHGTLILLVAKPLLAAKGFLPFTAPLSILCGLFCCLVMCLLALFTAKPIDYVMRLLEYHG
jgi:peptidoglycan/LPS O-acetylase OafA/YrhL